MTPEQLDSLEALAAAATPEPWRVGYDGASRPIITTGERTMWLSVGRLEGGAAHAYANEDNDAAFVAAAREAVPQLIAAYRVQQEALRRIVRYTDWDGKDSANSAGIMRELAKRALSES